MPQKPPNHSPIGLLLSGGLDSGILLWHLLDQGHAVTPFYIQSNLIWQTAELAALRQLTAASRRPALAELVVLDLPLHDLYGEHWSITGREVPDAATDDAAVFLPGRNALLLIKAALWCQLHGLRQLALGPLGSNPFPDATDDFFGDFQSSLVRGLQIPIEILRPFGTLSKRQVMHLGRHGPLGMTFSCIAPVGGRHCGRCNKCAERRAAFALIETDDPTNYANAAAAAPRITSSAYH